MLYKTQHRVTDTVDFGLSPLEGELHLWNAESWPHTFGMFLEITLTLAPSTPALARAVTRYVSRWTRHPARSSPLLQGGCLDHILGTWMTELAHQTDPGVTQKLFDKNRMVNTMSLHGYNYDNLRNRYVTYVGRFDDITSILEITENNEPE